MLLDFIPYYLALNPKAKPRSLRPRTTMTLIEPVSASLIIWVDLMKYWVRSLGPRYSRPSSTSSINSPLFPLGWRIIVQVCVSKGYQLKIQESLKLITGVWNSPHIIFADPVDIVNSGHDKGIFRALKHINIVFDWFIAIFKVSRSLCHGKRLVVI